jgi:hypothetical protein
MPEATGSRAAELRRKKERLRERMRVPADAIPGSLAASRRRCGKSSCHCADGEGHPVWSLTFMVNGKKRVEHIPLDLVEEVRSLVEAGRDFKEAVGDLFAINAELLVLARNQRRRPERVRPRKKKGSK